MAWSVAVVLLLLSCEAWTDIIPFMNNGPLHFRCPGGEHGIPVLETGMTIQDICGPEFELMYNGTDSPLTSGEINLIFTSLPDDSMGDATSLHSLPHTIGPVHGEWSLSAHLNVDMDSFPCGTGVIVAHVMDKSNPMMAYSAAQRAVNVCDFSGYDLELVVDGTFSNTSIISLTAGHSMSLMGQLSQQNAVIHKIGVRNNGWYHRSPNVTLENPQIVLAFLRHRHSPETMTPTCAVPSFSIYDAPLGAMKFTDGIEAMDMLEVMEDPHMPISVNFDMGPSICGSDVELVLMLDPLGMLNDTNPCNNFVRFPVFVDCYMHYGAEDTCRVIPNVITGREAILMFKDMTSAHVMMYKHNVDSNGEWHDFDAHSHDNQVEQVGLAKFGIIMRNLRWLYDEYGMTSFMCEEVMKSLKMSPMFEKMMGQSNYSLNAHRMSSVANFKMQVKSMNVMHNNDQLMSDIEMFGNDTYDVTDDILRMKIQGMAFGLQHAAGVKSMKDMMMLYGMTAPKNMTRTMMGPHVLGLAGLLMSLSQYPPMMAEHMLPMVVQHAASLMTFLEIDVIPFPPDVKENLGNIAYNLVNFPHDVIKTGNSTDMCEGSMVTKMAKYMWFLSQGHDGHMESQVHDEMTCRRLMARWYMANGGAHVMAKDILHEVADDMNQDMPMECRPHPYMPHHSAPVIWNVKDGRVWSGTYSPLGDVMTWKDVAVCRCDGCPDNHSNMMYSTQMPPMGHMDTTTSD